MIANIIDMINPDYVFILAALGVLAYRRDLFAFVLVSQLIASRSFSVFWDAFYDYHTPVFFFVVYTICLAAAGLSIMLKASRWLVFSYAFPMVYNLLVMIEFGISGEWPFISQNNDLLYWFFTDTYTYIMMHIVTIQILATAIQGKYSVDRHMDNDTDRASSDCGITSFTAKIEARTS